MLRLWYGDWVAVGRLLGPPDRYIDMHRDGIINGVSEHSKFIESLVLKLGMLQGTSAATKAAAAPKAKAKAASVAAAKKKAAFDAACDSILGGPMGSRLKRRAPAAAGPPAPSAAAAQPLVAIADAFDEIPHGNAVERAVEVPALMDYVPEPESQRFDFNLACQRCSIVHGVLKEMHDIYIAEGPTSSRLRKFFCYRVTKVSCGRA